MHLLSMSKFNNRKCVVDKIEINHKKTKVELNQPVIDYWVFELRFYNTFYFLTSSIE